MSESMMKEPISRRTFLKLAAGSAAGALLFHFPFQASAAEETAKTLEIRPCALSALPAAEESAKNSPLVKGSFKDIISQVNTIHDSGLKSAVLSMINHPEPSFMENYSSSSTIQKIYNKLVEMKLADPSKISAETLLPPLPSRLQPFMTAPGSGYMSHHPYPGGLATHVSSNLHITVLTRMCLATMWIMTPPWQGRPSMTLKSPSYSSGRKTAVPARNTPWPARGLTMC